MRVILGTRRGTQVLDRDLGISGEYVDAPTNRGRALLSADILDALPEQEPRVNVRSVRFADSIAGVLEGASAPVVDYEVVL